MLAAQVEQGLLHRAARHKMLHRLLCWRALNLLLRMYIVANIEPQKALSYFSPKILVFFKCNGHGAFPQYTFSYCGKF